MAPPSMWQEVGDGVLTRRYAFFDQQIGLVLGRGEALVIDTRTTPSHAREIVEDVRLVTRDPIAIVVDTHWHSDHAFGNSVFRPATIWGHDRCPAGILEHGPTARAHLIDAMPHLAEDLATVVFDPPDRTFADRTTIEVGGRPVELSYHGRGHTDADIVIRVPDADVLFAGDLLEAGATPYFGDGYPLDWPATVASLLPLATGPVVPGHGAVGDRAFVEAQLRAFRGFVDVALRVHDGVLDRDAAVAAMPFDAATAVEPLERALAQLRGELG
jgi:glyoxylase-like metal-dependent hydrolase (beta-lactamase superfamily II)